MNIKRAKPLFIQSTNSPLKTDIFQVEEAPSVLSVRAAQLDAQLEDVAPVINPTDGDALDDVPHYKNSGWLLDLDDNYPGMEWTRSGILRELDNDGNIGGKIVS